VLLATTLPTPMTLTPETLAITPTIADADTATCCAARQPA
jgi:hypothetical protein